MLHISARTDGNIYLVLTVVIVVIVVIVVVLVVVICLTFMKVFFGFV